MDEGVFFPIGVYIYFYVIKGGGVKNYIQNKNCQIFIKGKGGIQYIGLFYKYHKNIQEKCKEYASDQSLGP